MKWSACHVPPMPRGSYFLCFAKESNQRKATPTLVLILRCSGKSGTKKTRYAQIIFRSHRFFPPLLGANQWGPDEPIFDRFAMRSVSARLGGIFSAKLALEFAKGHQSRNPAIYVIHGYFVVF